MINFKFLVRLKYFKVFKENVYMIWQFENLCPSIHVLDIQLNFEVRNLTGKIILHVKLRTSIKDFLKNDTCSAISTLWY